MQFTIPRNTTAVQGIPTGKLNDLYNRVVALENSGIVASGFQAPLSGGLSGTNMWAVAPKAIVVDGQTLQQVQQDGTANWTGSTTTVLLVQPNFSVFAVA